MASCTGRSRAREGATIFGSWLTTDPAKGTVKDSYSRTMKFIVKCSQFDGCRWLLYSQVAAGVKLRMRKFHLCLTAASPWLCKRPRVLPIILPSAFGMAL